MTNDIQAGSAAKLILTIDNPDGQLPELSSVITKEIIVEFPDKTKKRYAASFVTDGSDWKIYVIMPSDDNTQNDVHSLRAYLDYGDGLNYYSEPETFLVGKNP